jgi:hypothetical protein
MKVYSIPELRMRNQQVLPGATRWAPDLLSFASAWVHNQSINENVYYRIVHTQTSRFCQVPPVELQICCHSPQPVYTINQSMKVYTRIAHACNQQVLSVQPVELQICCHHLPQPVYTINQSVLNVNYWIGHAQPADSVGDSRAPDLLSFAAACVHNQPINQWRCIPELRMRKPTGFARCNQLSSRSVVIRCSLSTQSINLLSVLQHCACANQQVLSVRPVEPFACILYNVDIIQKNKCKKLKFLECCIHILHLWETKTEIYCDLFFYECS